MLWLSGPAGTGKTAILQTISERCYANDGGEFLAATFFFSYRTPETRSLRYLVPTLAYQLAQRIPALAIPILKATRADPSVFKKNEDAQMRALVLAPIGEALRAGSSKGWPELIVVDAVDECDPEMVKDDDCSGARFRLEKEKIQRRVLDVLLPERAIRAFFNDASHGTMVNRITLDKDWSPDTDVALLLRCRFRTLCQQFGIADGVWPSEDVIRFLVKRAKGQFIYVATVMRWIEEAEGSSLQERLDMILGWENTHGDEDNMNPFQHLDNIYRRIISSCPAPSTSCLWLRIVHFLSTANFPAFVVDRFLGSQPGDVERVLGCLHSLLSVPENKKAKRYRFYHLSLPEFLASPSRCKDLYVSDDVWINYFVLRYLAFVRGGSLRNADFSIPLPDLHCISPSEEVVVAMLDFDVQTWVASAIANDDAQYCCWNFGNLYDWVHSQCPAVLPCTQLCRKWQTEIGEACERGDWTAPKRHARTIKGRYTDRFRKKRDTSVASVQARPSPSKVFLIILAVALLGAWCAVVGRSHFGKNVGDDATM
ncbi:hypothetical protein FA13DRAFT_47766 [Coprinellus micaceus]|uniref:Nephrocystin 3-like N-terminal domain-containing protein n=1 Tax=Coprinellus micaceus TaxID=71717 RepID=A0A4Y7U0S3_COPMI|nr:hypothetical protein FA13DRAFT_47766 [Coprinellus micaceus]